jgi:hypothetical protein
MTGVGDQIVPQAIEAIREGRVGVQVRPPGYNAAPWVDRILDIVERDPDQGTNPPKPGEVRRGQTKADKSPAGIAIKKSRAGTGKSRSDAVRSPRLDGALLN